LNLQKKMARHLPGHFFVALRARYCAGGKACWFGAAGGVMVGSLPGLAG